MAVVVERREQALVVRLDRPQARNAIDPGTAAALVEALESGEHDPEVRSVILTGSGTAAFCAGMDLRAFAAVASAGGDGGEAPVSPLTAFLRRPFAKPLIAAVNGPAVAGGFELVLACDLVVAADHAWFALPEVARGLFAAGGGVFLPRRLPLALAMEVGLVGARLDAQRALGVGLVNRVVPAAEVLGTALELAGAIAANGPLGVAATKALMLAAARSGTDELWAEVDRAKTSVFSSSDAQEGAAAFLERRPAVWTGG